MSKLGFVDNAMHLSQSKVTSAAYLKSVKDIDDMPPVIPYDLEKQLVRDFGGDDRPEDLVKNNDLEKDLVRNFGRVKDIDDMPAVIPYDLEKQLVRDFGGDERPE